MGWQSIQKYEMHGSKLMVCAFPIKPHLHAVLAGGSFSSQMQ